jgi:hypothetical protein
VHRADPYANRPSPRRRGRHDPLPTRGDPASTLLTPPLDPGPAPLTRTPGQQREQQRHRTAPISVYPAKCEDPG